MAHPRYRPSSDGIFVGIRDPCWYRPSQEGQGDAFDGREVPIGTTRTQAQETDGRWRFAAVVAADRREIVAAAYRFDGKQKLLALGVYPTVPLARARQAREDAKHLLAEGLDPALEKKRQAQIQVDSPTFRGIADEYVAKLRREKRSEATMAKVERLLGFAKAEFGDEPIGQVSAP